MVVRRVPHVLHVALLNMSGVLLETRRLEFARAP